MSKATTEGHGFTPLFGAAYCGHVQIVRFFIGPGLANVNQTLGDGHNVFPFVCDNKDVEICGRLLVAGITITSPNQFQHRMSHAV